MGYFPQRARKSLDISTLLKVCPDCLGDLVPIEDFSSEQYRCLQCNARTGPRTSVGRLPDMEFGVDTYPSSDDPRGREALIG